MKSITQLAATFNFQSYFDNTLLSTAILTAGNGNPIIDSTLQTAQNKGIGVVLHPASDAPVAIRFHGGEVNSTVIHLVPGQRMITGRFDKFDWGLPFGWLGGGAVILYVLGSEDMDVSFPSVDAPIVIQRLRMQIVNGNSVVAPGTPNWPLAFPWSNANRGTGGGNVTPQPAAPLISIIPDVTLLQYKAALGAPLDLNIQFTNAADPATNSPPDQAAGYSNLIQFLPITIPAVIGPNVAAPIWLTPPQSSLAGDACAVTILDPASAVGGQFVDVVRYGRFA